MATNISTIKINASRQKVWDTITKAELVKLWQYGSDLITTWEIGSDIKFRTEWEGRIFEQWGKVLEVRPNELVKYSLFAPRPDLEDKPENYSVVTYSLEDVGEAVRLSVSQKGFAAKENQQHSEQGWTEVLSKIKEIAESL